MTIVRSESKPLAPTEMPGLDACEALNAEAGSGALTAGAFVLHPSASCRCTATAWRKASTWSTAPERC